MNSADRILQLRKQRGISQEQLADILGVSRQTISKWESEQSTPDLEKIIQMSEYFQVTTDYILKGIEPVDDTSMKEKPNALIFTMAATAFDAIGVIVTALLWAQMKIELSAGMGLIFMVMGCLIYAVGRIVGKPDSVLMARKCFWRINIWMLTIIPLSLIRNWIMNWNGGLQDSEPWIGILAFPMIYLIIGVTVTMIIRVQEKNISRK